MSEAGKSRKRRSKSSSESSRHERSFIKHFRFELMVGSLLVLGIFLLVEDMHIKTVVYQGVVTLFQDITELINRIFIKFLGMVDVFETSDIVGIVLIVTAVVLYTSRVRQTAIDRYGDLSSCPDCGGDLHLIHRRPMDRLATKIFRLKVHRYQCKACDYEGLRIRAKRSR